MEKIDQRATYSGQNVFAISYITVTQSIQGLVHLYGSSHASTLDMYSRASWLTAGLESYGNAVSDCYHDVWKKAVIMIAKVLVGTCIAPIGWKSR